MTGSGEKFGKVDGNIKKGQPVGEACDHIMRAMYLGLTEVMIGDWLVQLLPYLMANTKLAQFLSQKFYKRQQNIKSKAE